MSINTLSIKSKRTAILLLLIAVVLLTITGSHASATPTKSQVQNCTNRYNLIKYRSQILSVYKDKEDQKYQNKRKAWTKSIAYNARWEPKQGITVRDNLYELDSLHAKSINELNRQIALYKTLQYQDFDCTKSVKNQALESKINEIEKSKNSGNALVRKYQKAENDYAQKDFKKSLNKLVKASFKQRDNFKSPETPPLIVRSYDASR